MRAFWVWACLYAQVWDISFRRNCAYSHWAVIGQDLVKREGNAHVFLQISSYTCRQAHLSILKVSWMYVARVMVLYSPISGRRVCLLANIQGLSSSQSFEVELPRSSRPHYESTSSLLASSECLRIKSTAKRLVVRPQFRSPTLAISARSCMNRSSMPSSKGNHQAHHYIGFLVTTCHF